MLNQIRTLLVGASLLVLVGLLGLYLYVQAGRGDSIFGAGSGMLPPTNFSDLLYPTDEPGYLLCPPTLCTQAAMPDGTAPVFNMPAAQLRQILADYADMMPTVRTHHFDIRENQFDFVERMPGQHLPAVVAVRVLEDTNYTSTLAIYSFQPVGDSENADHQARVERWLHHIRSQDNRQ